MFYSRRVNCAAAMLGIVGITAVAAASPASNITPTNYATETLEDAFKAENDDIELKTKAATIVRSQLLTFHANSTTGWHHHPGLVIVAVQSGSMDLWDEDCSKTTYGPGEPAGTVFIEALPHAHQATSAAGALVRVTYIVPSTGTVTPANFRVEEDVPACAQ